MAVGPLVQSLPPYPTRAGVLTTRVDTGRPERTCGVDTVRGRLSPTAILAMVAAAVFLTVANTSASAVSQPAIAATFGAGPADVGWVVFGYSGTFAVATALYGRLAARFGLGRTLSFGILLLAFGSLVAVVAPTLPAVIAARVIQGAGSGAIPTLSVAILATRFPSPKRQFAYGIITAVVGVAQALGPMIGGLLVDLISWRAAVAIGMLISPVAAFIWYDLPQRGDPAHRLDYAGAGSVLLMIGGFVYAINRVPMDGATLLTGGAVIIAALGAVLTASRAKRHPAPFIPRSVVCDRGFLPLAIAAFVGSASYLGTIVALPSALSRVYEIDAVGIGLVIVPAAASVAVASTVNSVAVRRLGHAATTLASLLFLLVGTGLLAALGIERGLGSVALMVIPLGIGFGLLTPPLVDAVTKRFEGTSQSIAIGVFYLGFFLGGSSGGALATGIIQRDLSIPLLGSGFPVGEAGLTAVALAGAVMMARILIRNPRRVDA
ncbi:MAG: MFS transporter [bacterium]|nr:MFS transporter [bacterium]